MALGRHQAAAAAWSIGLLGLGTPWAAEAKCELKRVASLPITMESLRPLLDAKINGRDAKFVIDSGAFYSMVSAPTAAQFGLKTYPAPPGFYLTGVGGRTGAQGTRIKEFTLLNTPIKNIEFLVGGSEIGYDGLLGQNLLENFDVEYDLAHGAIQLYKSDGCQKTRLAYWIEPGQNYSAMTIERIDPQHPHTVGTGTLNGEHIRIMFDTGAYTSLLSMRAAARAGIKPDSAGVTDGGSTGGIGRSRVRSYLAVFNSFKVGDGEEIKNAKLRFAETNDLDTDMLLGADFFVSHRVFVGNREHLLWLTYNGGPVFNLSRHADTVIANAAAGDAASAMPAADAVLTDPAELARRGSALSARRDFAPGIADLSKAVELAPAEPEYYYQRANAYWANGDSDKALADLDRVIGLRREFLPAYVPRAEIHLGRHERALALGNLDTVSELAPKQADLRLRLAQLYLEADQLPASVAEFGAWIDSHPDDSRLTQARAGRCLASAMLNQGLDAALSDCNAALRRTDKKSRGYDHLYVDRGLVYLRQVAYDKALADFAEALKLAPDNARALYGRAVAERHQQRTADAERDLALARKLSADGTAPLEKHGFGP